MKFAKWLRAALHPDTLTRLKYIKYRVAQFYSHHPPNQPPPPRRARSRYRLIAETGIDWKGARVACRRQPACVLFLHTRATGRPGNVSRRLHFNPPSSTYNFSKCACDKAQRRTGEFFFFFFIIERRLGEQPADKMLP